MRAHDEDPTGEHVSRPTIATISAQTGVSVSTVSQVLRGSGRISQQTRDKVLATAKAVNYVRDSRAAAMRSGQFREVGLLIHDISNPFNAEVLAGVTNRLEQHDYLVYVLDAQDDSIRQRRYLEMLVGHARGGLIWVPAQQTEQDSIALLRSQRIPTVTFLRSLPHKDFDHVTIENAAATAEATHYLIQQGYRHIAFFGGEGEIEARLQRIAGYRSAMADAAFDTVIWPCPDSKQSGAEALPALLAQHPSINALVCNGDMVAMGASLALNRRGQQAGRDLAIIGFDNTAEAELWTPPLSTLAVNPFGLGEKLAQTLLDRMEAPDEPVRQIHLAAQLTIRATA